jgi:ubiquinone/menaquinone biosynthesis C-methylase UbiE
MVLDTERAITLGHPSYVWRSGQERRLDLIRRYVPLEGRRILDIGCGLGAYVANFRRFTDEAYGMDVDPPRVQEGRRRGVENLMLAAAESLPFVDGSFDVIVLNEVIEHVRDDRATLREALRVLRPGGSVVIYAPNRLYPFETHGVYLGKRYIFGNIPLVNWLPNLLRNRVVPHARAYLHGDIHRLIRRLPAETVVHSYVYPGFDNVAGRSSTGAKLLRRVLYFLESTPLSRFGLSHFIVLRRTS